MTELEVMEKTAFEKEALDGVLFVFGSIPWLLTCTITQVLLHADRCCDLYVFPSCSQLPLLHTPLLHNTGRQGRSSLLIVSRNEVSTCHMSLLQA